MQSRIQLFLPTVLRGDMFSWSISVGAGFLMLVGIGATYHIGWNHGRECGVRAGKAYETGQKDEERQPRVKRLLVVPYALGWHHGWDHGFRAATRRASDPQK
jgi:hypothetical protein